MTPSFFWSILSMIARAWLSVRNLPWAHIHSKEINFDEFCSETKTHLSSRSHQSPRSVEYRTIWRDRERDADMPLCQAPRRLRPGQQLTRPHHVAWHRSGVETWESRNREMSSVVDQLRRIELFSRRNAPVLDHIGVKSVKTIEILPFVSWPNNIEISLTVRLPSLLVSSSLNVSIASFLFNDSARMLRMNSFCLQIKDDRLTCFSEQ